MHDHVEHINNPRPIKRAAGPTGEPRDWREAQADEHAAYLSQAGPPVRPLPAAIDGVEKSICVLDEKIDLLAQRLAFVLQPESPTTAGRCGPPDQRSPTSDSVERVGSLYHRLMFMASRIDGYLERLDI